MFLTSKHFPPVPNFLKSAPFEVLMPLWRTGILRHLLVPLSAYRSSPRNLWCQESEDDNDELPVDYEQPLGFACFCCFQHWDNHLDLMLKSFIHDANHEDFAGGPSSQ